MPAADAVVGTDPLGAPPPDTAADAPSCAGAAPVPEQAYEIEIGKADIKRE